MKHAVITGAGGFIGSVLARQILLNGLGNHPIGRLTLVDLHIAGALWACDPRVQIITGSIADRSVQDACTSADVDVVFHLASLPGGAAEKDYELGRRINLDATLGLIEALGRHGSPRRLVYASSIAVYGELPGGTLCEGEAVLRPALTYGTHKLTGELLLTDATRRGRVLGCSLRLPGVVARPGDGAGLLSSFMSQLFWCLAEGQQVTLPVSPHGKAWWISAQACAENLRHAAALTPEALLARNAFQMPALHLSCEEIVQALADRFGGDRFGLARYQPDPAVDRLFARYPALSTPFADEAGFAHDGDAARLVRHALQEA